MDNCQECESKHFKTRKWSDELGCYIHYWNVKNMEDIYVKCRNQDKMEYDKTKRKPITAKGHSIRWCIAQVNAVNINATDCPIEVSDGFNQVTLAVESDLWREVSKLVNRLQEIAKGESEI